MSKATEENEQKVTTKKFSSMRIQFILEIYMYRQK